MDKNKKYVVIGSLVGAAAVTLAGSLLYAKKVVNKKNKEEMDETEKFFFTQECVLQAKKHYQKNGYITYVAKYGVNLQNIPYLKIYHKKKISKCEVVAYVGEEYSEEFLKSFIKDINEKKISFVATTPEGFKCIKSFITTVVKNDLYPDITIHLEKHKK